MVASKKKKKATGKKLEVIVLQKETLNTAQDINVGIRETNERNEKNCKILN